MDCKKNNKTPHAGRQQLSLITSDSWQVFKNIEISIIVYFLKRAFISSSHCVSCFFLILWKLLLGPITTVTQITEKNPSEN